MLDLSMSIAELIALFESNKNWDKQYRVLIQLGKKLPTLDDLDKVEANEVKIVGAMYDVKSGEVTWM